MSRSARYPALCFCPRVTACTLLALAALLAWAPRARAAEPTLVLPGGLEVHAGEVVQLCWTPADDVRELEVLVLDAGAQDHVLSVSPQLDPHVCAFRWQVPVSAKGVLRLRVRFQRGGREIEGAPTRQLHVRDGIADAIALALPPAPAPESDPRPSDGRGSDAGGGARIGPWELRGADEMPSRAALANDASFWPFAGRSRASACEQARSSIPRTPRDVPMRT